MQQTSITRGRVRFARARGRAIEAARRQLLATSWPRVQMTLIVALTGASGLLSSFLMLQAGLDSMALRYPLAVLIAYGCFLLLVWLWLRTSADDYAGLDLPTTGGGGSRPCTPASDGGTFRAGGGGDFAGGGASAHFDAPDAALGDSLAAPDLKDASAVLDGDELAVPLLVGALIIGLALASCYVIYIAPVLLAEVLVDGAASYALYRHLQGEDPHHWLASALRRTVLPFVATALFVSAVGAAMGWLVPQARSVGEVVRAFSN